MDGRIGHTEEIRIEAVRQFESGPSYCAVATNLGLPIGTLRDWQDSYLQGRLLNTALVRENRS